MSIPLSIADKPGQGELWAQIRMLSNDYLDAINRGDKHEAGCIERRLAQARTKFHQLHQHKERPCESSY